MRGALGTLSHPPEASIALLERGHVLGKVLCELWALRAASQSLRRVGSWDVELASWRIAPGRGWTQSFSIFAVAKSDLVNEGPFPLVSEVIWNTDSTLSQVLVCRAVRAWLGTAALFVSLEGLLSLTWSSGLSGDTREL